MNQFKGVKPSAGRIVLCSILAGIVGLIQPFAVMLQLMLPMPAVSIAMMLCVALYAYAGWIPAGILMGLGAVCSLFSFGFAPGLIVLLMWVLPAVLMILGIRSKRPFFEQMRRGIGVCLAATALAIALTALMVGGDMIAAAMEQVRAAFEAQKDSIWTAVQAALEGMPMRLGKEEFLEAYYAVFDMLQSYYEYYLLSNLLTGAVISAMVSVLWGNWLSARRGEATKDSFQGLSEWFLPANMTFGILLVLAASLILARAGIAGGQTAWVVVCSLAQLAFMVQAFAALDRRMRASGSGRGKRTALILLLIIGGAMLGRIFGILSLYDVLAFAGCASTLFGSKGAAKPWIQKIKDKMDGEDR